MKIQLIVLLALVAIVTARRRGHWKKNNDRCRYDRGEWSECNTSTNQATMTMTLKEGSAETCEQTRVKTMPCDRLEKLKEWKTKKEEKRKMLAEHIEEKKRVRSQKKVIKEKFGICKFEITVSECNKETNLVTKTFTPTVTDVADCKPESIAYSCELHERLMQWKNKRHERKENRRNKNKRKNGRFHIKKERS